VKLEYIKGDKVAVKMEPASIDGVALLTKKRPAAKNANLEKKNKKKKKNSYFSLKEGSYHANLRKHKLNLISKTNVALNVVKRDAINYSPVLLDYKEGKKGNKNETG